MQLSYSVLIIIIGKPLIPADQTVYYSTTQPTVGTSSPCTVYPTGMLYSHNGILVMICCLSICLYYCLILLS